MAAERVQRRLAAILAADVVGYSRLMGEDETGTLARLKDCRAEIVDPCLARFGGRIVKVMGDGVLVEFTSAVDAVQAAIDVQTAMAERNDGVPETNRMAFRVGVHLGDVIVDGDDIHGDGVNVAARLEGLSEAGSICISDDVYRQVRGKVEAEFDDLGPRQVKNIAEPVHAHAVRPVGARTTDTRPPPDDPSAADGTPPLAEKPSIAVLPFANMSGDPEQEYFSDGITEDIITGLSRVRWFLVIARNSTFSYKGQSPDIRQVAHDLGARYVLEGSVRKAGNRVRITAQLIEASTGAHVWAERYDREIEDIFDVQDEITQTVVGTIEPELSRAEQERARLKPPDNMDAWDCHLQGLWHVWRFNKSDNLKAQANFERAVAYDPAFCAAFSGLAYAHEQAFGLGFTDAPERSLEAADEAARTAIALDERDSFACWAMGGVPFIFRRDYHGAIEWLRRSIALNPSFAPAHGWLGHCLAVHGRIDEAFRILETAERLSPKDPLLWAFYMSRGFAHLSQEDYQSAEIWGKRGVAIPNAGLWVHCLHAAALGHLGRQDEARTAVAEMSRVKPDISIDFVARRAPATEPIVMQLVEGLRMAGLAE